MNNQYIDPATGLPRMTSAATAETIQPQITGVPQQFVEQREHYMFTLPTSCLPASWRRRDEDRTFALTLLSTSEEEAGLRAATASGTMDASKIGKHWMLNTVYAIGGVYTGRNFDTISTWLDDIGPKGRKLVDMAFTKLHNVDTAEGEAFLAGMQRKG